MDNKSTFCLEIIPHIDIEKKLSNKTITNGKR